MIGLVPFFGGFSLDVMLCRWSVQSEELAQVVESFVNLMKIRLPPPSSYEFGSEGAVGVLQRSPWGLRGRWGLEWRELRGRHNLAGYFARRGSDRGCSEEGQEMGEAMDFICTDPSGLICSYRALETKRYFLCNSFDSKT